MTCTHNHWARHNWITLKPKQWKDTVHQVYEACSFFSEKKDCCDISSAIPCHFISFNFAGPIRWPEGKYANVCVISPAYIYIYCNKVENMTKKGKNLFSNAISAFDENTLPPSLCVSV